MTVESEKRINSAAADSSNFVNEAPKADISSLLTKTDKSVSPWLAVSFSLFIYPGAGQIMNRRVGKGVIFGLFFTILMGLALYYIVNGALDFLIPNLRPGAEIRNHTSALWGLNANFSAAVSWSALSLVCYLWSALDAMLDSRRLREKKEKVD